MDLCSQVPLMETINVNHNPNTDLMLSGGSDGDYKEYLQSALLSDQQAEP